jgi:hypothetical protein
MYATTQAQTTEKRKGRNCQDKNSICNINDTSSSSDAQQKQIQCASKIRTLANSHQQEKSLKNCWKWEKNKFKASLQTPKDTVLFT